MMNELEEKLPIGMVCEWREGYEPLAIAACTEVEVVAHLRRDGGWSLAVVWRDPQSMEDLLLTVTPEQIRRKRTEAERHLEKLEELAERLGPLGYTVQVFRAEPGQDESLNSDIDWRSV